VSLVNGEVRESAGDDEISDGFGLGKGNNSFG